MKKSNRERVEFLRLDVALSILQVTLCVLVLVSLWMPISATGAG